MVLLQGLENRLFSEGLHVFGQPPTPESMNQYLDAYFDNAVPAEALKTVSEETLDLQSIKNRLEASLDLVGTRHLRFGPLAGAFIPINLHPHFSHP